MSLKERIISEAVKLYNEKGISRVTMKELADYLKISPGNLTYHYKTKSDLILAIYDIMHVEAAGYLETEGYVTLHHFEKAMTSYYQFNQRYKFFFNDVVFISREFPEVGKRYEASNMLRYKQGRMLLDYFVSSGRMVPESENVNYDRLVHIVWMTMAFWTAQSFIINDESYQVNKVSPVEMVWNLLLPLLTEKGLAEYKEIRSYIPIERH
ncbi:MAG: TetR/AcrR family transcriptional regulator [bacterium]|nr:TetR/AcrR family transcriptional regulator [bacterium]